MLFFLTGLFDLLCLLVQGLFFLLDLFTGIALSFKFLSRACDICFSWLDSPDDKGEDK